MAKVIEAITCFHCGDDCQNELLYFEGKYFCCHGCKAVYELIQNSRLHQYYDNSELRTSRISDKVAIERKFGMLDHAEVEAQLLRFRDEKKSIVRFYIAGIHCSSCIYLLEHLPKFKNGILRAEVNFIRKEITITYDHSVISLKQLAVLLSGLGYEPTINLELMDAAKRNVKGSSIGLKIAVAGFCFGNSMLFSLPAYLDSGFQLDANFKELFGWINLALLIPVIFFSARDYFISAWKGIKHSFLNIDVPIAIGITTLVFRTFYEIVWDIGPGYTDSLTGLVFFLLIGKWYQGKSYEALSFERDFTSYFPITVSKMEGDTEKSTLIKELKAGDIILIHNQELIPADGLIVNGNGNLDYSFVTGESELVTKRSGDNIFAGGRQVGGPVQIQLLKSVDNSELTQLWNSNVFHKEENYEYSNLVDKVSRYFTLFVLLIAILTGIYWMMTDPEKVWNSVTAVLIIACPCALALALPFSYGHAMRKLGKQGVYLKNSSFIENLSKVREIIFDKTGTLTKTTADKITFVGHDLSEETLSIIKTATGNSAHPYSRLITKSIKPEIVKLPITNFREEISKGLTAEIQGSKIQIGSANWLEIVDREAQKGSRVYIKIDNEVLGYYAIKSSYRDGIFESIKALRKEYSLHLLSGDSETEMRVLAPYFNHLLFNQKPDDKLNYLKEMGKNSLMIGDGLNDAGALKSAFVGIAVSEDIHQFSPSSDAILSASSIQQIPQILHFTKWVLRILMIAFVISFLYNLIGLSFAMTGNLSPIISAILMPISSITVVGFITLAINTISYKIFNGASSG